MTALAPTLQAFFTERLAHQLGASAHTIAAYRDTWRLLLTFTTARTGIAATKLDIGDLDTTLVGSFLNYLEDERANSIRTRNGRLAAIHSTFTFAALRHPEHAEMIARVLAIPPKRYDRTQVTYLNPARSPPCWVLPIVRTGPVDVTVLGSCSRSPAGCGYLSSPH